MTCCPSSSSVSSACFITAEAIDLKLCTSVPLGHDSREDISVRSDSCLGHQGAKTENAKSAKTPQLMAGSSPNFYHGYI
jgi:hypothetical protein